MALTRIAVLSPYADPVVGGISSYTRELVDAYGRIGVEVRGYATLGEDNQWFKILGPDKFGFIARAIRSLIGSKQEIIHAHSQHWYVLVPVIVAKAYRPRTRILFTFHTPVFEKRRGAISVIHRISLLFSTCVVFVSRSMMEGFHLRPSVRQGVILGAPERAAMGRDPIAPKRPTVLYAGPFAWPKKVAGVLTLLEAFAGVAREFPEWRLTILGDGPLRPLVERKVAELDLEQQVNLRGFVESVFDEIAAAEIYAHVSLQEGLPLSILNAMGLGTTVLATRVGGIPEVIRHRANGFLVEPNKNDVEMGLSTLMSDPALRVKLAEAARDYVTRELSWEKTAARYLQLASREPI